VGVPEFWGVITSLSTVFALTSWMHQWRMYRGLTDETGLFLGEMIIYFDADREEKILVTEPEQVLAATVRFWDRAKKHLPGWLITGHLSEPECLPPHMLQSSPTNG